MEKDPLERLRAICLALPEATEGAGVGTPSFRVRDKIFAMQHPVEGRRSLWCKAAPELQAALVRSHPDRFFVPPYVGQHGWIGAWFDADLDWDEVADLVEDSYRRSAPKRLLARISR
ncbi:MAG TPA: MmcQ/YjbR family DNA-binding protein [Chloroflexia bacterium]|nr:MmcQ/YjbR family DNA-binding protein [Chloroflexia bacterium]